MLIFFDIMIYKVSSLWLTRSTSIDLCDRCNVLNEIDEEARTTSDSLTRDGKRCWSKSASRRGPAKAAVPCVRATRGAAERPLILRGSSPPSTGLASAGARAREEAMTLAREVSRA